jgi:hypothetical protein
MNRRNFLGFLGAGAAAAVAVRTFPFRVYSFPERRIVNGFDYLTDDARDVWYLNPEQLKAFGHIERIEALQLEIFRKEIPTLMDRERRLFEMLRPDRASLGVGSASSFRVPIDIDPIAAPMQNFSLESVASRFRRLIKGA